MTLHVVWDWNGTLLDDLPQVHQATNAALRTVGAGPLDLPEYIRLFTRPLPLFYRRVLGRDVSEAEWDLVNHHFQMSYDRVFHHARLADEALAALETVARSGATQSILSLYQHEALTSLVSEWNIAGYFTRVQGVRGYSGASKVGMFADHLRSAAPEIPPHRVVMIGDTDDDLAAAQAAGSSGILINHHGHHALGDATLESYFADGLLEALKKAGLKPLDGMRGFPEGPGRMNSHAAL